MRVRSEVDGLEKVVCCSREDPSGHLIWEPSVQKTFLSCFLPRDHEVLEEECLLGLLGSLEWDSGGRNWDLADLHGHAQNREDEMAGLHGLFLDCDRLTSDPDPVGGRCLSRGLEVPRTYVLLCERAGLHGYGYRQVRCCCVVHLSSAMMYGKTCDLGRCP